jgi:hypothetical protein
VAAERARHPVAAAPGRQMSRHAREVDGSHASVGGDGAAGGRSSGDKVTASVRDGVSSDRVIRPGASRACGAARPRFSSSRASRERRAPDAGRGAECAKGLKIFSFSGYGWPRGGRLGRGRIRAKALENWSFCLSVARTVLRYGRFENQTVTPDLMEC